MRISWQRALRTLAVALAVGAVGAVQPVSAQDDPVDVEMGELNDSGLSGSASLEAAGDETVVSVDLDGATGDHPSHIHEGTCDTLNPAPLYTLTDVDADGISETTVPVSLDELLESEYAINIHLSVDDIATYVSCGDIVAADAAAPDVDSDDADDDADDDAAADTGTGGTTTNTTAAVPSTGVGTAVARSQNAAVLALAALAGLLGLGGLTLRRREVRA